MPDHGTESDGMTCSSAQEGVHAAWGPHPDLFDRLVNVSLSDSSVTEFSPSPLCGRGSTVRGPQGEQVHLLRLSAPSLPFPCDGHSFLVSRTSG